jgi:hypothetical protein
LTNASIGSGKIGAPNKVRRGEGALERWPVAGARHGNMAHSAVPRSGRGGGKRDRHSTAAARGDGQAFLDLTTALSVSAGDTDSEQYCYRQDLRAEFTRFSIFPCNLGGFCRSRRLASAILGVLRVVRTIRRRAGPPSCRRAYRAVAGGIPVRSCSTPFCHIAGSSPPLPASCSGERGPAARENTLRSSLTPLDGGIALQHLAQLPLSSTCAHFSQQLTKKPASL